MKNLATLVALVGATAVSSEFAYSEVPAVYLGAAAKSSPSGFLINCGLFGALLKQGAGPLLGLPLDNLECPSGTTLWAKGPCTSTQLADGIPVCSLDVCCFAGDTPTLDPAILQVTAAAGAAVVAQAAQIAAEAKPFVEAGQTSTATQFLVNCGTYYQFLAEGATCPPNAPVFSEYPCTNVPFVDGVDACTEAVCCVAEADRVEPNAIGVRVGGIAAKTVAAKVAAAKLEALPYITAAEESNADVQLVNCKTWSLYIANNPLSGVTFSCPNGDELQPAVPCTNGGTLQPEIPECSAMACCGEDASEGVPLIGKTIAVQTSLAVIKTINEKFLLVKPYLEGLSRTVALYKEAAGGFPTNFILTCKVWTKYFEGSCGSKEVDSPLPCSLAKGLAPGLDVCNRNICCGVLSRLVPKVALELAQFAAGIITDYLEFIAEATRQVDAASDVSGTKNFIQTCLTWDKLYGGKCDSGKMDDDMYCSYKSGLSEGIRKCTQEVCCNDLSSVFPQIFLDVIQFKVGKTVQAAYVAAFDPGNILLNCGTWQNLDFGKCNSKDDVSFDLPCSRYSSLASTQLDLEKCRYSWCCTDVDRDETWPKEAREVAEASSDAVTVGLGALRTSTTNFVMNCETWAWAFGGKCDSDTKGLDKRMYCSKEKDLITGIQDCAQDVCCEDKSQKLALMGRDAIAIATKAANAVQVNVLALNSKPKNFITTCGLYFGVLKGLDTSCSGYSKFTMDFYLPCTTGENDSPTVSQCSKKWCCELYSSEFLGPVQRIAFGVGQKLTQLILTPPIPTGIPTTTATTTATTTTTSTANPAPTAAPADKGPILSRPKVV